MWNDACSTIYSKCASLIILHVTDWVASEMKKIRKTFQLWMNLCQNVRWHLHMELENR